MALRVHRPNTSRTGEHCHIYETGSLRPDPRATLHCVGGHSTLVHQSLRVPIEVIGLLSIKDNFEIGPEHGQNPPPMWTNIDYKMSSTCEQA